MGRNIKLTAADGHELDAWRADPAGEARGGIVVVQEIFGVNEHIRDICERLAGTGYTAIAPAVFDRVETGVELGYDDDGIARGRELRGGIQWDEVMADIAAAVEVLKAEGKVGVVGFCWGGSLAWLAACRLGVDAAVGYYGGQIIDFKDEQPTCPVLLHFGETDGSIPLTDVEAIKDAQPKVPVHVYEGAGHGFNCDRRGSFDAASAATAWDLTLSLFVEHIG